jgi:hypothetical protein
MDLSTLARVKVHLDATGQKIVKAESESMLSALITAYSASFETYLNRTVEATSRTLQTNVHPGERVFELPAYPVTAITSVKNAEDRDFASATAIDSDDYYCDTEKGLLYVDGYVLLPGPGVLQVVYTGGMAADAASFVTAFPEIAAALDLQVVSHWQRKDQLAAQGVSLGQGSKSFTGPVKLMPEVRATLAKFRRVAIA